MSEQKAIYIPCEVGKVSDGFHTFDELYEHRCLLFICLANHSTMKSWKSKKHNDGTCIQGWFIAGVDLPTGTITYHIPDKHWDLTKFPELDTAPQWDGHTADDVLSRLKQFIKEYQLRFNQEFS